MFQAPNITSFIAVVIFIAATGAALDKLVLGRRLDAWRRKIAQLWIKLNTPGARGLAQDANQLYCDLFDYIYGSKAFSRRRVWASILSSMIGLVVISLIIGYESSVWHRIVRGLGRQDLTYLTYIIYVLFPVLLNFVPDFFSLIETRFVLKWSKGRGPLGIVFLIILDLVLTATIFMLGCFLLYIVFSLTSGRGMSLSDFLGPFPDALFEAWSLLIFFLTTFVTSFFWILFILTFGIIWIFQRVSPLANFVYYQIGQSDRPATALSAFVNGLVIMGYTLWIVLGAIVGG